MGTPLLINQLVCTKVYKIGFIGETGPHPFQLFHQKPANKSASYWFKTQIPKILNGINRFIWFTNKVSIVNRSVFKLNNFLQ
jgi:hypothetical protein